MQNGNEAVNWTSSASRGLRQPYKPRFFVAALLVLTFSEAATADGCGMSLAAQLGDQAEFINDIAHLRETKVRSIHEFSICGPSEAWCKSGDLIGDKHFFDRSGRLVSIDDPQLGTTTYRYEKKGRYPIEEANGSVTKIERDSEGRPFRTTNAKYGSTYLSTWELRAGQLVVRSKSGSSPEYQERAFVNGRLQWEVSEGQPMLNIGGGPAPSSGTPKTRVDCEYVELEGGQTRVVSRESDGTRSFIRKEDTLDPRGRVRKQWWLSFVPSQAAEGRGDGLVHSYLDVDAMGNWTRWQRCKVGKDWNDIISCNETKRVIAYW